MKVFIQHQLKYIKVMDELKKHDKYIAEKEILKRNAIWKNRKRSVCDWYKFKRQFDEMIKCGKEC